jgi:hypothetical protein
VTGEKTGDLKATSADIAAAINKTTSDVRRLQSGLNIPVEEKLASTEVLRITPDYSTYDINVLIALTNVAGTRAFFNVTA